MITVIPWKDFVACPLRGMLLQVRRTKRLGDLWGEIGEVTYDGRELVVVLTHEFSGDPREEGIVVAGKVEPVRILPKQQGPVYTEHVAFAVRDLNTGYECFIRPQRIAVMTNKRRRTIVPTS